MALRQTHIKMDVGPPPFWGNLHILGLKGLSVVYLFRYPEMCVRIGYRELGLLSVGYQDPLVMESCVSHVHRDESSDTPRRSDSCLYHLPRKWHRSCYLIFPRDVHCTPVQKVE